MEKNINVRLTLKHDTEENWKKATGFIPKLSEPIVYDKDDTHPYKRYKIGDGVTNVNILPFERGVGQEILEGGEIFNDYINNKAVGLYSTARGTYTIASGIGANALGYGAVAAGDYSIAMGTSRKRSIISEISIQLIETDLGEGLKPYAYFHTEDSVDFISGIQLTLTGNTTGLQVVCQVHSMQNEGAGFGIFLESSGLDFGENQETWRIQTLEGSLATGLCAFAGGFNAIANGTSSFAFGQRVTADKAASAVFGKFNKYDANAIFTIGDGTSTAASNAFTVRSDSTNGASIVIGNTAITEAQLQALLALLNPSDPAVTESSMQEYVNETILGGEW